MTRSGDLRLDALAAIAWRATAAARPMSSYDELVHEPISAAEIVAG